MKLKLRMPEIRPADVASILVVIGLGAQGYGFHLALGPWALVVLGTEVAILGLVGVFGNAG